MSDSRLEKFIYTICSMDVSDLPVPLSRIEKLWNCLITGETPDFEPLSRNEKYLMAMLDRYDISNLPAPMSRGEKLLYKIVVGETDLSDVPGYLSRYEELLKYLIENGGISEGDFEYVLYTLNQSMYTLYTTAEKPVKSAILKGNTLVNLSKEKTITITTTTSDYVWNNRQVKLDSNLFKAGKKYLYSSKYSYTNDVFNDENPIYFIMVKKDETSERVFLETKEKGIFTIPTDFETTDTLYMRVHAAVGTAIDNTVTCDDIKILEYQNGMENWDIPYFEGMQSVRMPVLTTTGKNLYDPNNGRPKNLNFFYNNEQKNELTSHSTILSCSVQITKGKKYSLSFSGSVPLKIHKSGQFEEVKSGCTSKVGRHYTEQTITAQMNGYWVIMFSYTEDGVTDNWTQNARDWENELNLMIVEDDTPSSYEPYKSNILSTSEDVTLRGIGDVKDELNLITGELTQRIGEIVLDGSEEWKIEYNTFRTTVISNKVFNQTNSTDRAKHHLTSDKYASRTHIDSWESGKFIALHVSKEIVIKDGDFTTTRDWVQHLQQNPVTVQYRLATESVKTVDLTVVDQDNQPTELGTFENVTHVSLEAENLIPEVEMEVATRISTELASASPLMDDISTKQEQLNTTIDEQSENVDATMIATTEIFEETL